MCLDRIGFCLRHLWPVAERNFQQLSKTFCVFPKSCHEFAFVSREHWFPPTSPHRSCSPPAAGPARHGSARRWRDPVVLCIVLLLSGWVGGGGTTWRAPPGTSYPPPPPTLRMFAGWCAGVCSRLCRIEKAPAWLSTSFATSMGGWEEGHHAPHHHHTWTKRAHIEVVSKPEIP